MKCLTNYLIRISSHYSFLLNYFLLFGLFFF